MYCGHQAACCLPAMVLKQPLTSTCNAQRTSSNHHGCDGAFLPPQALVDTQAKQKEAKRYEDGVAGRYKLHAADPVALAAELERAKARQERVRAVVEGLAAATDELQPQLRRVLAHAGPA